MTQSSTIQYLILPQQSTLQQLDKNLLDQYGNQLRVRVCGICVKEGKILLINHSGLNESGEFWSPPGGGLQFGETIEDCLKREFLEETNTMISIGKFLTIKEFIKPPLHAIELFYEVKIKSGNVKKGFDPEMEEQIIKDIQWMSFEEILAKRETNVHEILRHISQIIAS
jgi:8-oxo-dGTP diphosphatase